MFYLYLPVVNNRANQGVFIPKSYVKYSSAKSVKLIYTRVCVRKRIATRKIEFETAVIGNIRVTIFFYLITLLYNIITFSLAYHTCKCPDRAISVEPDSCLQC